MSTKATYTVTGTYYTAGVLAIDPLTCGSCGVAFGVERSMLQERQSSGRYFWCPNGDKISYTETEADRLKRDLKWQRDRAAQLTAERDQIEASRRAYKGQATKLRNRAIAGECPICGQHLRDLTRHMGRVHPDEKPEE